MQLQRRGGYYNRDNYKIEFHPKTATKDQIERALTIFELTGVPPTAADLKDLDNFKARHATG